MKQSTEASSASNTSPMQKGMQPSAQGSGRPRTSLITRVARERKMVGLTLGAFVLFFVALSFVLPQTFESITTVLPPEHHGMGGMLSALASTAGLDLLKGSDNPTLDLYKTIIESRAVAEEVAKDPKIRRFYSAQDTSFKSIVSSVQSTVQSEALRTGMFTVTIDVKTPWGANSEEVENARKMSAYIANRYIVELDRYNRDRLMSTAHSTRVFIEGEYNNRLSQLDSSYRRLQAFQEEHKAIALPEQLAATVSAASKLGSAVQQLEMQIGVEERDLGQNSTRIQALRAELDATRAQLLKYDDGGAGEYMIALKNVPELSRDLAKLMRETKVLEQVTAYLRQQLEEERISEQRDLPSLQVLDAGVVPDHRSSPHRSIMLALGLFFGVIVSLIRVSFRSFKESLQAQPEAHYRYINFVNAIKHGRRANLLQPTNLASTSGTEIPSIGMQERVQEQHANA